MQSRYEYSVVKILFSNLQACIKERQRRQSVEHRFFYDKIAILLLLINRLNKS